MPVKETETSLWPLTAWQEVRAAGRAAGKAVTPVDELFCKYQRPLRVHLLRRFRTFPVILNHADDLLQEFAAAKILKEGWLNKSDPRRGRFRDFLRKSLENLVWSWWKQQPEYKTWRQHLQAGQAEDGPDSEIPDLRPVALLESQPAPEPEADEFNLAWAQTILTETLQRMEQDCCKDCGKEQPKRRQIWEVFRVRMLEPIFNDVEALPYCDLVERFGLKSPTEASNMLLTAKRMFQRHLKCVIAEYESEGGAVTELQELKQALSRFTGRQDASRE